MSAFPAADVDITTAYLAAFSVVGIEEARESGGLAFEDAKVKLRACLAEAARGDVSLAFDPPRTRWLASVIAGIVPGGDVVPIATAADQVPGFQAWRDVYRAEGTRPVLPFTGAHLFVSALRTGREPEIAWARSWRPDGTTQQGVRRGTPLYGATRSGDKGPVIGLAQLRNRQKRAAAASGDPEVVSTETRRAAASRLVGIAAGYGLFGHTKAGTEAPGEWWAPLFSAAVTSTVQLWVGVAEHLLAERDITVMSRDTDGLLLRCRPDQWADLLDALALFAVLDPFGDGTAFWKVSVEHEGRPLCAVVLRVKRYVIFTRNDDGSLREVVEFTEHALAGTVADPPCLPGRLPNGKHRFAEPVAEYAARLALDPDCAAPDWEWGGSPEIERHEARSVKTFERLSRELPGLRPFGAYLRAGREYRSDPVPYALDDGTDLAGYRALAWYAGRRPIFVSTHLGDHRDTILLRTLGERGRNWVIPKRQDTSPIICHPDMIRYVGRSGPALEALRADHEADPDEYRKVYKPEDGRAIVESAARKIGKRAFGRLVQLKPSTAGDVISGRASDAVVREALAALRVPVPPASVCETPECDEPIPRAGKRFCDCCAKARRRERDRARRVEARQAEVGRGLR